jgi:glucose/arabinose dehydrogenase
MRRIFLLGIAVLSLSAPAFLKSAPPAGFAETTFVEDALLGNATGLAWAPDGSNRLFVIRKGGEVRIIESGVLRPNPFATLPQVFTNSECGLIGICFDPDFLANRYVYFFVTVSNNEQRIVRYRDNNSVGQAFTVLVPGLPTNGQNHDGGAIGIGPDGHLYWAIGDLGNGAGVNANLTSLAAKVGRANRFTGTPLADNPFNDGAGPNNEYIWARGFRNPFTMTFHPISGDLWLNVVGTNYEQTFVVNRGSHGGYNEFENDQPQGFLQPKIAYRTNGTDMRNITAQGVVREGNVATFTTTGNHGFRAGGKITIEGVDDASFNGTFFVRERISPTSFSVSQTGSNASSGGGTATSAFVGGCLNGGTFYESTLFPAEYRGNYFFGDFNSGNLMRATIAGNTSVTSVDTFATGASNYVDAVTGPDGALYHTGVFSGIIKRITPESVPQGLIVYPTAIRVQEGSQSLFTVRLTQAPAANVTVNIAKRDGGDLHLNTSAAPLTFTPENWNVPQSVLVAADFDQDRTIGKAEFDLTATDMETQTVTAFELDGISQSTFPKTLVYRTGDQVPNEPEGTVFKTFGIPSFHGDDLGFLATIQTPSGNRSAIIAGGALVRQGDPAPGTDTVFVSFKDPVFHGNIAFPARLKTGAGTNARNDDGIWDFEGSELKLVAREGDPAPGADGATFLKFVSLAIPDSQVAFVAQLKIGSGNGEQKVSSANDLGLWRVVAGSLALVLREGDTLTFDPGPPRTVKKFQTLGLVPGSEDQRRSHSLNGSVLILVDFDDGTQGIVESPVGGGSLIARAVTGDAIAAPAGEILDRLGIPVYFNQVTAFAGTLKPSALVNTGNDAALFSGTESGDFSAIVREGDIAPSTGDALFTGFGPPALSSLNSNLTFQGTLKKGSGDPAVNQGSDTGLWTTAGGPLRLIAREGQLAIGTSGYFSKFLSFAVFPTATPERAIAFTASLRLGKGRVTASNRLGLWAMDKDGNLELVQRVGDKVTLPNRATRVLSQLALKAAPQSPGQGRATDENGQIVYRATFQGGGQGIYVVQLP